MRPLNVVVIVSLVYACSLNLLMVHHYHYQVHRSRPQTIAPVPTHHIVVNHTIKCTAWTHASLILAPRETHPRSNDPSETIRSLAPIKRMLKRLASGHTYLAVSIQTFMPSHRVWCERLQTETANRVACHLLLIDNSTTATALHALRELQPCLSAVLVVEDPLAVDGGLISRLAAVSIGHYACLAALKYNHHCPVYVMPLRS